MIFSKIILNLVKYLKKICIIKYFLKFLKNYKQIFNYNNQKITKIENKKLDWTK